MAKRQDSSSPPPPFDEETWAQLPSFFDKLPEPVRLHMWGEEMATDGERETAVLCRALADHFDQIRFRQFPRRINYNYWPVIGVQGEQEGETGEPETVDYGVRIIGWPTGYQLTSLISAIQVVSFRGQTLEPRTRIQLARLPEAVDLEILTAADNETGALVAKHAFGLAVASEKVRVFLIMADMFPEALVQFSVNELPHTVVNGRYHIEGPLEEEQLLEHIAAALRQ